MPDQANDLLKEYRAFAQQSWDAWMRYVQQQSGHAHLFGMDLGTAALSQEDLLNRSLASLKAYGSWLQQAADAGLGQLWPWPQPPVMSSFFAAFGQPFGEAAPGLDSACAGGLGCPWETWLQAMQQAGMTAGLPHRQMAAFGMTRPFQLDQQALQAAMQDYAQVNARYQGLLQRVYVQGMAKLQELLAQHAEAGKQLDSLKALYNLWVDAMEEAYAKMALSQEYREVFGALVNAQMQLRALQQKQLERMCRALGMPTRSEIDSLGKRVQELRRAWQARAQAEAAVEPREIDTLRNELAFLKRELAAIKAAKRSSPGGRTAGENGKSAVSRDKTTRALTGKQK